MAAWQWSHPHFTNDYLRNGAYPWSYDPGRLIFRRFAERVESRDAPVIRFRLEFTLADRDQPRMVFPYYCPTVLAGSRKARRVPTISSEAGST
jgi:hypothetical protein